MPFLISGFLFGIAEEAAHRAKGSANDDVSTDVAIAVVFAAASLEGFINELGQLVQESSQNERGKRFAAIAAEAEAGNAQTLQKYQIASILLLGRAMEKGHQPYQHLALLLALRNHYAHLKPVDKFVVSDGSFQVIEAAILARLRPLGVLRAVSEDTVASWVTRVSTPATAGWAVKTAQDVVRHFHRGCTRPGHAYRPGRYLWEDVSRT